MLTKDKKRGVQGVNTYKDVIDGLQAAGDENPSLRTKARAINRWIASRGLKIEITHDVVRRLEKGIEPKDEAKRIALGLPVLHLAPVCPSCGQVHIKVRCPSKQTRTPRKPRRNIKREIGLRLLGGIWGQK